MNKGKFYGVSVGPGDGGLMTLKAYRLLSAIRVIAAPLADGRMRALEIAKEEVDVSEKELLPLPFEMTTSKEVRQNQRRAAADAIADYLDRGQDVAMLNLGDVSVYATASYVCGHLQERGYETEMVPGVPSFCAAAAATGRALAENDQPLHILSGAGFDDISALRGTKVILKPGRNVAPLLERLVEQGISADVVENCGLPDMHVYHLPEDAERMGRPGYFTTILLGE